MDLSKGRFGSLSPGNTRALARARMRAPTHAPTPRHAQACRHPFRRRMRIMDSYSFSSSASRTRHALSLLNTHSGAAGFAGRQAPPAGPFDRPKLEVQRVRAGCVPVACRFRAGSGPVPGRFRAGSGPMSQRVRASKRNRLVPKAPPIAGVSGPRPNRFRLRPAGSASGRLAAARGGVDLAGEGGRKRQLRESPENAEKRRKSAEAPAVGREEGARALQTR